MAEQPLTLEQARAFVRFALNDEMELVNVTRPDKDRSIWPTNVWVAKKSGKKIISQRKLERMSVAEFAEYLNGRVGYKKFPDPNVYR